MANHAMDKARKAEREISDGKYLGPFHGVPVAVKDLCFPVRGSHYPLVLELARRPVVESSTQLSRLEVTLYSKVVLSSHGVTCHRETWVPMTRHPAAGT